MKFRAPYVVSSLALGALFLLLLVPVTFMLAKGSSAASEEALFSDPFLRRIVLFTYVQAGLSAFCAGWLGVAGALVWSEQEFRGRQALWGVARLCFALPSILLVLALLGLWGKEGIFSQGLRALGIHSAWSMPYGWPALLLANSFFNFPLYFMGVGTALRDLDRAPECAALSLGASRWRCFLEVTLPRLWPEIRSAFVLAFLYSSAASFIVVLMLGGGPRFTTIEVAIYQAIKVEFNLGFASRLAVLQIGVASLVYLALLYSRRAANAPGERHFVPLFRFHSAWGNRTVLWGYLLVLGAVAAAPLVSLVFSGLVSLPLLQWDEIVGPLGASVCLALGVGVGSVTLAFALAYLERHTTWPLVGTFVGALAGFPLSLSALLLLFALTFTYPILREHPGSLWIIGAVQSVMALPPVYRQVRDAFFRVPDALIQAAQSLGAGPTRVLLKVEWPLISNALRVAGLLAVAFSLGEVSSVLLFAGSGVTTLPLLLYRYLSSYRFGEAYGVGFLLLVTLASVGLLSRGIKR